MILVLLSRFSEFRQSYVGCRTCKTLVEHGDPIYIMRTVIGEELRAEIIDAAKITLDSSDSFCSYLGVNLHLMDSV